MRDVEQVMTGDTAAIRPGETVAAAAAFLSASQASAVPVVEDDRLVGLITIWNVLSAPPHRLVAEAMSREVATVSRKTAMTAAYKLMAAQRIWHLAVVDEDRLVGMITRESVLAALGRPFDPLTELPWAAALREQGADYLRHGLEIAIVFLDLDDFRTLNTQFGHGIGDRCLEAVAQVLGGVLDPSRDLLCRYGSDEFAILTTRWRDEAASLAGRASDAISAVKLPSPAEHVGLTASIGVAGGRRTDERTGAHVEATVEDLLTIAMEQMDEVRSEKARRCPKAGAVPGAEVRLRLQRVHVTTERGLVAASVELGLGPSRYLGEVQGAELDETRWQLLAQATIRAVNQVLPEGWLTQVDEVHVIRTPRVHLAVVTLYLGMPAATAVRAAGCAVAGADAGQAVVRATLDAVNRRLGRLLERGALLQEH
jgi:diguanylate cyclase (GGDEF)-like protein